MVNSLLARDAKAGSPVIRAALSLDASDPGPDPRDEPARPEEVVHAAESLKYRDFLTVVLIVDRAETFPDNWIYIHEPQVKLGRIQNFKNWSPDLVPDPRKRASGSSTSASRATTCGPAPTRS